MTDNSFYVWIIFSNVRGPILLTQYFGFTLNFSKMRFHFLQNTSSGSVCCNDVIVQLSVETLPFGGVGESGYGGYHGELKFKNHINWKSSKCNYLEFF